MYRVPAVVVVEGMCGSPSARIVVSYLTETCTTSDTSLPTWYRTTGPGPADRSSQDQPHSESLARGGPPMNGDQSSGTGSVPLSLDQRVDEACDRFEKAWKEGQGPHIEDY